MILAGWIVKFNRLFVLRRRRKADIKQILKRKYYEIRAFDRQIWDQNNQKKQDEWLLKNISSPRSCIY